MIHGQNAVLKYIPYEMLLDGRYAIPESTSVAKSKYKSARHPAVSRSLQLSIDSRVGPMDGFMNFSEYMVESLFQIGGGGRGGGGGGGECTCTHIKSKFILSRLS